MHLLISVSPQLSIISELILPLAYLFTSFSDILIGDYFTNKTSAGMINAMNKNSINKKGLGIVKIVGNYMEKMK